MNPLRGIGLKVLSVCVFTVMAICIKASAPHVPPGQAVFFRSFFAMPVILGWLAWQHDLRHGLETRQSARAPLARAGRHLGHGARLHRARAPAAAGGDGARLCRAAAHGDLRRHVPRRAGARLPADGGLVGLVGVVIVLLPNLTLTKPRRRLGGAGGRRDGGAPRRGLRRAGAGLRAQAHPHREDGDHRLLLLADRLGAVARHPALRLGGAGAARGGAPGRRGAPRRAWGRSC